MCVVILFMGKYNFLETILTSQATRALQADPTQAEIDLACGEQVRSLGLRILEAYIDFDY